jgi:hypothetical protein
MTEQPIMVGRVLRASTTSFALGRSQPIAEQDELAPEFGLWVKAYDARKRIIYGLVYDVSVDDDAFVRQLVAAGVQSAEVIEDQRQNRQVLLSVMVLIVGCGQEDQIYHRLPPQPPGTLSEIYRCPDAEILRFTARQDWLRTVLGAADVPVEQLLGAAVRAAAAVRPPDQRDPYLIEAGRELVRLLAMDDLPLAEAILRQCRS